MSKRKRDTQEDNELEALREIEEELAREEPSKKRIRFSTPPPISDSLLPSQPSISPERDYRLGDVRDTAPNSLDYVTATTEDGDIVYIPLITDKKDEEDIPETNHNSDRVLSRPIKELIRIVDEKRFNAAPEAETPTKKPETPASTDLFVDKYAPNTFTDLLSNEKINREVLYWVKEWDPIVFNKVSVQPKKSFFAQRNEKKFGNANPSDTPQGPEQKILLIAGPPGVGKTTLAHIVAKQAGYHPVEINASDDRSKDKLMSMIENATQMKNNMFGDQKPNLIILDEIDGLENSESRSGISALLNLAYPPKQRETSDKNEKGDKPKKVKPIKQLNRPIICICNDHYAPVLRDLRLKAKLVIFRKNQVSERDTIQRMSDRLLHICQREEIAKHFEKKHLLELASQSEGDIRSCLNTIQFMSSHMRTNKNANLTSMNKDIKSDFFQTLTSIFVKDEENKNSARELAEELLGIDMDRTEKLLQGCFENYADIRFNSSGDLQEVLTALEWTQWSDILNLKIRQHQAFALASYQVFPLLTYHTQCGSMYKNQFHKNGILTYPRKEGEVRAKITSNKNIIATITPQLALQHHNNGIDIYTDIAPTLVSLLQPSILSGSTGGAGGGRVNQLLSMTGSALKTEEEKQAVDRVVDLCSSYGLTFKLSSVMGKYQYILDPPLDAVSHFPSAPVVQKSKFNAFKKQDDEVQSTLNLPYNIKKMIASEVEMRKYSKPKVKSQKKEMLPPKDLASPTKFENNRNNKYCAKSSSMGTDYYVFFQFREGNSSAVRRPAKINEFL